METFEIDAAPASAEGEAAAEPVKRGIPRVVVRALRVVMALCAVLSVIVGVILVILGATQRFSPDVAETMLINNTAANSTAREALQRAFDDEAKLFNNPFAGVAGLGCAMTVWSVAGFVGAFVFSPDTEWRRSFATGFAGFSVAIVAADFFVACLCFVFGRLTVAYVTIYWPYIAKSVHPMTMAEASEYVETHLNWMGWITLLVIVVHVAMLGITSTLVGWRHMISRMQTFLTLTLAFGSLCVIGVCVWSSQYAPWLDTHGSVLLTWMVAACCLATIFIAIVGAATSMAMGDKPQAGWLGAVGRWLHARPWAARVFIVAQIVTVFCITCAFFLAMIIAFTVSDSAHKGLAAEVEKLEEEATRPTKVASEKAHVDTVIASHFALVGVACMMVVFCLVSDLVYGVLFLCTIKKRKGDYDDDAARGGVGAAGSGYGDHAQLDESLDDSDGDRVETISFRDDSDDVLDGIGPGRSE